MTPEQEQLLMNLEARLNRLEKSDRYTFEKTIQMLDGRNIQTGRANGTKIALSVLEKLGFYGTTPVVQGSNISAPTGGSTIDSEARTAINSIRDVLINLGLIAS